MESFYGAQAQYHASPNWMPTINDDKNDQDGLDLYRLAYGVCSSLKDVHIYESDSFDLRMYMINTE